MYWTSQGARSKKYADLFILGLYSGLYGLGSVQTTSITCQKVTLGICISC